MTTYSSDPVARQVSPLHPDVTRFNFWRPHTTPIPAFLLRVTGWLQEGMEVMTESTDGQYVVHQESGRQVRATFTSNPSDSDRVLFQVERPGTRERQDWEIVMVRLWKLYNAQRAAQQEAEVIRARLEPINQRIAAFDAEEKATMAPWAERAHKLCDTIANLKAAAAAASGAPPGKLRVEVPAGVLGLPVCEAVPVEIDGPGPSPLGARRATEAEIRAVELVRKTWAALDAEWQRLHAPFARRREDLELEKAPVVARLRFAETASTNRVQVGLYSQINAFLTMQALSAASVAIEEFRKTPRHASAVIEEMEARLATD